MLGKDQYKDYYLAMKKAWSTDKNYNMDNLKNITFNQSSHTNGMILFI